MKKLFFISCLIVLNFRETSSQVLIGHGTAIFFYVSKDSIWILSDSKQQMLYDSGIEVKTVKKIGNVKQTFYGSAGAVLLVNRGNHSDTMFNADKIIRHFLSSTRTLEMCVTLINDSVVKYLNRIQEYSDNNQRFKECLSTPNGITFFETGIVQFLLGKPNFKFTKFEMDTVNNKFYARQLNTPDYRHQPFFKAMGYYDCAEPLVNQKLDKVKSIMNGMIDLIKLEIDNHKHDLGGPINVVLLTAKGCKWYPAIDYKN